MNFKKHVLSNGLRIITVPTRGNPSVTVLVATETGSNYESKEQNGISHFLEHMCFKGTKRRISALDITRELDALGAENNAFTSNEITAYHAKAEKKHLDKLLDVISDLYLSPTMPENDLEKEKGVILQEISMYEDVPRARVWHVLIELVYGDTPAGRPVIGPKDNIRKFTREDFIKYHAEHYVAEKTIIIVAGDISPKKTLALVKKYFKDIPHGKKIAKPAVHRHQHAPALKIQYKKSDQTHMIMAFPSYAANDKRLPALNILSTILGQGMSSRLFHRLREEMGACYYVRTVNEEFTDHGLLSINTGIESKRAEEVTKVLIEECKAMTESLVSEEELAKAKEYYVGHLYMQLETSDALAEFYVDEEVSTRKLLTPKDIEKEIRSVTALDVLNVAKDLFCNENLNLAIVGNVRSEKKIKKALKF